MKHEIFPTPVWHIKGAPQQLIDELLHGAEICKNTVETNARSNEGGYQSPTLEWEDFHSQGREYVDKVIDETFEKKFKLTHCQWWYNINPKGAWNIPYSHPGAHFALVFYITDSDGLLRFMNPNQMRMYETNSKIAEAYGSLYAKRGDIIIFPSDLMHYVIPNPREEDRISISMNLQLC